MLSLVCTVKNNKYIVNVNNFRVFTEKNGRPAPLKLTSSGHAGLDSHTQQ